MASTEALAEVLRYHDRTKHLPGRFARSLGYLDWGTQPDPFRRYEGAPLLRLDEVPPTTAPSFDELYRPEHLTARPFDRAGVAQLLYDSMALSAWKSFGGDRWSLRCNPSSGNLHPTETYLLAGPIDGLTKEPGLYHYDVLHHGLERRGTIADETWTALVEGLSGARLLVGLTSIHWREAWKYGERAFRYCHHDVGHALGGIAMAAAALGWRVRLLDGVSDEQCATLLGVAGQRGPEAEHPDALLWVGPASSAAAIAADPPSRHGVPDAVHAALEGMRLQGVPNRLSVDHHRWPIIDEIAAATATAGRPIAEPSPAHALMNAEGAPPVEASAGALAELQSATMSGRRILRERRSAMAMDGATELDAPSFHRMLAATMPATHPPPLLALPWSPALHLLLFVHRVTGLEPGVYVLPRHPAQLEPLRAAMDPQFEWFAVPDAPPQVPLRRLDRGDVQLAARQLSCDQAIASDGVFAVAMLAEFEPRLREQGPWFYRRLFWEAGAVGQLLYLEAEAAGLRGTGIGCFFDDAVHQVLGLAGHRYQALYHFTVGSPVSDPRLQTLPPYPRSKDGRARGGPWSCARRPR